MATDQLAWRGRNDNGNETTATWKAAQNTTWVQATDQNFRARFLIQISGGAGTGINNLNIQYQYSTDGSNWVSVTGTSNVVRSSASPNLADNATTTQQLTGGTGSYQGATGFDESAGNAGGPSMDIADDGCFEVEFCAQVRSADVTNNQTIYLRTWNADASAAWTTYSGGTATITASFPAITAAFSDPWANLADTDGLTIDLQEIQGATPKTFTGESNLNTWTDSPSAAYRSISVGLTDSAANLSDPQPRLIEDHFFSFPDDAANLADSLGISLSSLTALLADLPADEWANLADAVASMRTMDASLPDDMGTLDDLLAVIRAAPATARLIVGHRAF